MSDGESTVPGSLAAALAAYQANLPKVGKGETAAVKDNKGTILYKYQYVDLADVSAAVLPRIGALGLSFTSKPTLIDGEFVLAYSLKHSCGESDDGVYPLPKSGTPQQIGSAITYARRYCLLAVTGTAPGDADDDGAAASTQVMETSRRPQSAGDAFAAASPAPPRGRPQADVNQDSHPRRSHPVRRSGQAPEVVTDLDWMAHIVDDLLPAATTRSELAKFWDDVAGKVNEGHCTEEHAKQVRAMVTERAAELGFEKGAAA